MCTPHTHHPTPTRPPQYHTNQPQHTLDMASAASFFFRHLRDSSSSSNNNKSKPATTPAIINGIFASSRLPWFSPPDTFSLEESWIAGDGVPKRGGRKLCRGVVETWSRVVDGYVGQHVGQRVCTRGGNVSHVVRHGIATIISTTLTMNHKCQQEYEPTHVPFPCAVDLHWRRRGDDW